MPNVDQIFGQLRPALQLAATILICAGLAKFAGFNVPINGAWRELGLAGFLSKHV